MLDKRFSQTDQNTLLELLRHRRDVRGNRFNDQELDDDTLGQILEAAAMAPSVGLSQPWEFVVIRDTAIKQQVADIFEIENTAAQTAFTDRKAEQYATLKLEGILATPVNVAVFYKPSQGPVLGQTSMPQVGEYSVVCAVQNMWLMSRALNVGMGWVSILHAEKVKALLNAPQDHKLVAYLCLGQVDQFLESPELEQLKWAERKPVADVIVREKYR